MVVEANLENFDEVIQGEYVVMDMYGTYCPACVVLAPIFEAASIQMPFLTFAHFNVQAFDDKSIALKYNINFIPTILYFRKGELVYRSVGDSSMEELNEHLAKLLYE